ncbi:hypothetical protein [Sodalinema gerasimenkoae]|uniref:hypothetical protein n=1 Tax=Sodalinema gerasimenkoae TaxID=2862348 RepID=UPI001358F615|nr:hypothetical protein [Sodalinema gerasimenkoae]
MVSIRELVQEAIASGYLSLKAENQLRQRLATKYDFEDFQAILELQDAAMAGKVRQESRELLEQSS